LAGLAAAAVLLSKTPLPLLLLLPLLLSKQSLLLLYLLLLLPQYLLHLEHLLHVVAPGLKVTGISWDREGGEEGGVETNIRKARESSCLHSCCCCRAWWWCCWW
jgi:hypothetical protein